MVWSHMLFTIWIFLYREGYGDRTLPFSCTRVLQDRAVPDILFNDALDR